MTASSGRAGAGEPPLEAGLIGLGRMGLGVARRLLGAGWRVVGWDLAAPACREAAKAGVHVAQSARDVVASLRPPRRIWLMVPAGEPVDRTLFDPSHGIQALLEPGDVVIDGGNSFYEDSRRRARELRERAGAWLVDCGSSGGVEGAEQGLCLMVGGQPEAVEVAFPLLQALAAPGGLAHVGPPGAGHFVKMVHNAVEYGMLQAIGEGFELLSAAPFALDLHQVADLWTHGSVVRGWLMELLARALARDPRLEGLRGVVGGGETGGWAIQEAWRRGVPFSTLASAYAMRLRSRQEESVAAKVVAALRREFGGHSVTPARQAAGGER